MSEVWKEQRSRLRLMIALDSNWYLSPADKDVIRAALDRIESYEKSMNHMADAAISTWEDACQEVERMRALALQIAERLACASEVLGKLAERKDRRKT